MANKIFFSASIVDDNIDDIKAATKEQLEAAFEEISLYAQGFAVLLCPVDTGNLRSSITPASDDTRAVIGTNVEYAPYVELGTSKMKEQPYLRPAIENHIDFYKGVLQEHLQE